MSETTIETTASVLTEVRDNVLIITLNRPEAKNAATREMTERMIEILDDFDANPQLAVAVLTGAGATFCAGMDLKRFAQLGERPMIEGKGFLGLTESHVRKPLIAAVEGYALAGGFETVLACDLVVAAETAKFGVPEVKRGLVAAAGGALRLPQLTHRAIALEMLLTGDIYPASFGATHGFVNKLVGEGEALDAAVELAQKIAANGPLAVATTKQIVRESPAWPADQALDRQRELIDPVFASEDAQEGATAFAEKRAPRWSGR